MKNIFLIPALFFMLTCISCTQQTGNSDNLKFGPDDIKVTWKLITNITDERGIAKASFTLENNSPYILGSKGWALYFNQFDTRFKEGSQSAPVSLHNLGGDFCSLTPEDKFKLEPGNSITITYEVHGAMIKWTDAPQGVYLVFYNKDGSEEERVRVGNYVIAQFTKPDQMNRGAYDHVPVPDARYLYDKYNRVHKVDSSTIAPILPVPKSYIRYAGAVTLNASTVIHYAQGLDNEVDNLNKFMIRLLGARLKSELSGISGDGIIVLKTGPVNVDGISKEAYTLDVQPGKGILITGSDAAGVFYGIESLVQLAPLQAFKNPENEVQIPALSVRDAPSFPYRGMHLDVARDFSKKSTVMKLIDLMAFYKLNRLHMHLTDDEGWRLEIKELPELTDYGSKRGHTLTEEKYLHPSYGSGPEPDSSVSFGTGFYSREDFIEILKHAYRRHIDVIPEIEMPGHARSAIKSMEARYRKLMAEGKKEAAEEYRLIDPDDSSEYSSAQDYHDNVVCVARESVYRFYSVVLDDIIQLYKDAGVPLIMWHVAGDEVPSGAWEKSPLCEDFLKKDPSLKTARDLQPYFFSRIVKMVRDKNLPVGGWEEMAMKPAAGGGWTPNPDFIGKQVYPFVWNSVGRNTDLGYRLANAGYPVILCNVNSFYFDQAYNKDPREPGLYWGGFVGTEEAFKFVPYNLFLSLSDNTMGRRINTTEMEKLKPSAIKNIIGLQGELWSETIKGQNMLEYDYLPKMLGLAHSAWNGEPAWAAAKDSAARAVKYLESWNQFANHLADFDLPRLDYIFGGYNYRISPPGIMFDNGKAVANTEYPGMTIRYTTDGTEPTENSTRYSGPVEVKGTIKMKTFNTRGRGSLTTEVEGK